MYILKKTIFYLVLFHVFTNMFTETFFWSVTNIVFSV